MATGDDRSSEDELWLKMDPFVQRFEEAWQNGDRPAIDDFLPKDGPDCLRQAVLAKLVEVDMERRRQAGDPWRREDYLKRYPELAGNPTVLFNSSQHPPVHVGATPIPNHIGRYRVEKILGSGTFGLVYLAHDEQLKRRVAIKVPHPELVARPEDAEPYLAEAQIVAGLDHPNIVPVYDMGEYPFFVVSKYIEGATLAQWIKGHRVAVLEATELVATVAGALHYAHLKRLVHRDIKPGNILLDSRTGSTRLPVPFVADFGLALREQDYDKGRGVMGTPAYLSPEQANGEGHRVDGRSDIFSLGVVFYELLTRMRPFQASTVDGLLDQIKNVDVRPPRQRDDTIPKELERICLKALSRRASERYTTAKDMTDDLRHFLKQQALEKPRTDAPSPHLADLVPIKIVPKGLRSFDNHDADFFLELIPGPRDREGLPDSIRFWKTRIEEMDADDTFAVGLLYGPSGCGKSSLVKAGLLPRLNGDVLAVYVEATARDTEPRLLKGLRKRCPALTVYMGLKETLAAMRRGEGIPSGKKVLIILDQFEQWLHANKEQENTELVEALRQCDGTRVQCLVMVRDDFWLAVSRFLKELEVPLLEGHNSALVDLFDTDHAKKVLAAFGRAFGKHPANSRDVSKEQKQFLEQAVAGLAREGKVICVRLALFAEMMKSKTWTPASLRAVGGTAGVGVTFLEETLSAAAAPPEHRYHQHAARGVLKALLPESGTDIKGHMRSRDELLEGSGYGNRSADFDDLIHLLDSEIRLITPTDPEGRDEGRVARGEQETTSLGPHPSPPATRFYQLTHDYLVHSLRDWLTQKQKETWRGRAEIRMTDRAALWTGKPENRNLPSWWEWTNIRLWTRRQHWTLPQKKMMRQATRYHGARGLLVAVCLTLVVWGIYEGRGRLEAHHLRDRLLDADTTEISSIVEAMSSYRRWINPLLYEAYDQALRSNDRRKQLRAGLALLPVDPTKVDVVLARLLDADPNEVPVIRDALAVLLQEPRIVNKLWAAVEKPATAKERLRGAAALAKFNAQDERWNQYSRQVAEDLVAVNSVNLGIWSALFRPLRAPLLSPLGTIFRDRDTNKTQQRIQATSLLTDYASDQPKVLADLLMDADDKQFADFFPLVEEHEEACIVEFQDEIRKKSGTDAATEKQAKRQANAAVALLRMNRPDMVWPLFALSRDPSVRSYLIHYLAPRGADMNVILKRLDVETEVASRRALIQSLGEFAVKDWAPSQRDALVKKLQDLYQTDDDPGIHDAVEWLLRQPALQMEEWVRKTNDDWAKNPDARGKRLEHVQRELSKESGKPNWYVNSEGHTMIVIDAHSRPGELSSNKTLDRCFAIAAKEVTVDQYLRFRLHRYDKRYSPEPDCPINTVTWYDAAKYCRWLSEREGFENDQMCFPPREEIKSGMRLPKDYLQRCGYRLPTGTEWEYSCRAGTRTERYYGNGYELLAKYAWHEYSISPNDRDNANLWYLPVGRLKPNDWGLFDMLGNVIEWCQEKGGLHILPGKDEEDLEQIGETARGLRGGSLSIARNKMDASNQEGWSPGAVFVSAGFRVVRTFKPKP